MNSQHLPDAGNYSVSGGPHLVLGHLRHGNPSRPLKSVPCSRGDGQLNIPLLSDARQTLVLLRMIKQYRAISEIEE